MPETVWGYRTQDAYEQKLINMFGQFQKIDISILPLEKRTVILNALDPTFVISSTTSEDDYWDDWDGDDEDWGGGYSCCDYGGPPFDKFISKNNEISILSLGKDTEFVIAFDYGDPVIYKVG